jgi:hypothetical protein
MPAKKNGVITTSEARVIARDAAAMRKAILALQVEAGDRVDDPRYLSLNKSEADRGYRQIGKQEYEEIRAIVRKLVDAARERSDS